MNINEEQEKYISIIKKCFERKNPSIDCLDDFDWLYEDEEITSNFEIKTGSTKVVLIPININTNYVYKIPVLGMFDVHFINDDYDEKIDEGYEYFSRFDPEGHNDFCAIEVDRCYDICKVGYGNLIAKEYYYGKISNDIPIYIQEKALIYYDAFDGDALRTEEEIASVKNVTSSFFNFDEYFNCIPDKWIADLISAIGIEETIEFFDFLIDASYNNDLHEANIGYIKGKPVLVDYSGFIYQWGWEEDYED